MRNIKNENVNYKLWMMLTLISLLPQLYSVVRVHLLGSLPDQSTFQIISQISWLNAGYEVLSEGLIIPLAYLLGQVVNNKKYSVNA